MATTLTATTGPQLRDPTTWITSCDYARVQSLDELRAFVAENRASKSPIAVDFETTSLDLYHGQCRPVGVNLSTAPGVARYVPVGHYVGFRQNLPWDGVVQVLRELDEVGVPTVYFNARYDHEVLHLSTPDQWYPERAFEDAMVAVWLADCHAKTFGLKASAERWLGLTMPTFQATVEGRNFAELEPDAAVIYACADADCTRRLWLHPMVAAAVQRQREVYALERLLIAPFRRMLRNGQDWDDRHLATIEAALGAEIKGKGGRILTPATGTIGALTDEILDIWETCYRTRAARAGDPGMVERLTAKAQRRALNFDAPAQVGAFLVDLEVAMVEQTAGKQTATGKEVLEQVRCQHADTCGTRTGALACSCGHTCRFGDRARPRPRRGAPPAMVRGWLCHPVVERLIRRRELTAIARNYVSKIRRGIAAHGPRLHFPFRQLGAPTGRMSSGGERFATEAGVVPVNEQSLPDAKKQPYLPDVRAGLVGDPDHGSPDPYVIVAVDFSQIELRVAANLSKEPAWMDAFRAGEDIHLRNAQLAYAEPTMARYLPDPSDPSRTIENPKRGKGKTMSFAVLFGAEARTVAEHGGIAEREAARLLDTFWQGAPVLKRWIDQTHASARCEKIVRTCAGRERPLTPWYTPDTLAPGSPRAFVAEKGDREAVNTQIQGGAAEVFKIAMVRVDRLLTAEDWHAHCQCLLPMHDELVFRIRRSMVERIVPQLLQTMATEPYPSANPDAFQITGWTVPILAEAEIGENWGKGLTAYRPAEPSAPPTMATEPQPQPPPPRRPLHAYRPQVA